MLNKIKALTKIFIKDFYQNTKLIDKETKKINKKSLYFWVLIILGMAMIYISYKGIDLCKKIGSPEVFLYLYSIILSILVIIQIIIICTNILFFSKDLEFVLHLPIKSKELLLAKFNTILFIAYISEIILGLIPLILYGFMNYTGFDYFIWLILSLLLLPIIFVAITSLLAILLMKIFSFIRNKNILQNVISITLTALFIFLENKLIGDFTNTQEINYLFNILSSETMILEKIKYITIMISLSIITILIMTLIGNKIYLSFILNSLSISKRRYKRKNKNSIKIKNNNNVGYSYIKKEVKMLLKQPTFFIQTIFPVMVILISLLIIANIFIPIIDSTIQSDETIKASLEGMNFNSEMVCVILIVLQCLFSLSNLSITAISREGKSAIFIKYIPVSYYKQFIYKNVMQVTLNILVSIIILFIVYSYIPEIGVINVFLVFLLSIFINLINSYLALIIDLKTPYLNWNSEHSAIKRNDNKSFQYGITIVMILIYLYLSNIFKNLNITLMIIIEIVIFMLVFILIDRIVKRKSNKLFDNII